MYIDVCMHACMCVRLVQKREDRSLSRNVGFVRTNSYSAKHYKLYGLASKVQAECTPNPKPITSKRKTREFEDLDRIYACACCACSVFTCLCMCVYYMI